MSDGSSPARDGRVERALGKPTLEHAAAWADEDERIRLTGDVGSVHSKVKSELVVQEGRRGDCPQAFVALRFPCEDVDLARASLTTWATVTVRVA